MQLFGNFKATWSSRSQHRASRSVYRECGALCPDITDVSIPPSDTSHLSDHFKQHFDNLLLLRLELRRRQVITRPYLWLTCSCPCFSQLYVQSSAPFHKQTTCHRTSRQYNCFSHLCDPRTSKFGFTRSRRNFPCTALPRKRHTTTTQPQSFLLMVPATSPTFNPSDATPYQNLKTEVLERFMPSECVRLQQLLAEGDLGDRRPSHLLQQMRQLLGEHNPIPVVLAAAGDANLDRLAELTDKVHEATAASAHAVSPTADKVISHLEDRMDQLAASISALRSPLQETRWPRSSNRALPRTREAGSPSTPPFCWYHRRCRHRATKCTPCS
ncbi:hypothetical protein HPB50_021568 [Hyalomma asiaticum]|uniref:Uncharacterized protein n=1 Tax=Hyalomma asiaticum TaxID=266040 RepID=A0ACB7T0R4_HYAAI|nr:hypothetical protein HPB50_021568 [Hyalomma asiaticum]